MILPLTQLQTFLFMKDWKSQRFIQNPFKHLRWSSLQKYLCKKLHLRCSTRFRIRLYILLGKKVLRGKIGRIKEWSFANRFGETSPNRLLLLPKNSIYTISWNKKTKWLTLTRLGFSRRTNLNQYNLIQLVNNLFKIHWK